MVRVTNCPKSGKAYSVGLFEFGLLRVHQGEAFGHHSHDELPVFVEHLGLERVSAFSFLCRYKLALG